MPHPLLCSSIQVRLLRSVLVAYGGMAEPLKRFERLEQLEPKPAPANLAWKDFFATCPRGLELLLAEELQQFKAEKIHVVGGGVEFGGDFWLSYRINLESRIASRVLWQAATGRYRNEDDIYRAAYALPWTDWFDPASHHPGRCLRNQESAYQSQVRDS